MSNQVVKATNNTKVSVGNVSTQILAHNSARAWAAIVNDSDEAVYISVGAAAVMNEGARINPRGGSFVIDSELVFFDAIYGICAAGGKNVTVMEMS